MLDFRVIRKILTEDFLDLKEKEFLRLRLEGKSLKEIQSFLNLTLEEVDKISLSIKSKLKANLTPQELKSYIAFFNQSSSLDKLSVASSDLVCDDLGKDSTLWISHSAISDFKKCHLLYYYRNVYKSPLTDRKIEIVKPYTSLGNAVHKVIEEVANLNPQDREKVSLKEILTRIWKENYQGEKGGFKTTQEEKSYFNQALEMLETFRKSEIFKKPALLPEEMFKVKILESSPKPAYLVGRVDWIEILEDNSAHIVDFKTGRKLEEEDSLQLPIYYLLSAYNLEYPVKKVSYFYLRRDEEPSSFQVMSISDSLPLIYNLAEKILELREVGIYRCTAQDPSKCECQEYRQVVEGKGKWLGTSSNNRELYII